MKKELDKIKREIERLRVQKRAIYYIKDRREEFIKEVTNVIWNLGGMTQAYGHSTELDKLKEQSYFLIRL